MSLIGQKPILSRARNRRKKRRRWSAKYESHSRDFAGLPNAGEDDIVLHVATASALRRSRETLWPPPGFRYQSVIFAWYRGRERERLAVN
jgi:hypothetical protein